MNEQLNKNIISFLCHATIPQQKDATSLKEGHQEKTDLSKLSANKAEIDRAGNDYAANQNDYYDPSENTISKQEPVRVAPKTGRNAPCPCGSGKKYKHCHGKLG